MAVIDNTTTAADIDFSLDVEFAKNFNQEYDRLADVLGIVTPEVVAAGTAMYQTTVSGALSEAEVAEGDEVPLSKYTVKKTPIGETELRAYRKLTTAKAVLQSGYEAAVIKTDAKMMKDVRASIIDRFFGFLANGTGTAQGDTLQLALARADATLATALEANGDHADRIVHFVNNMDVAEYLGTAQVTVQTVFGMTYLETFLGLTDVFVTSKVPAGTFYVTPAENIHMYGVDFGALSSMGLAYTVYEGSLIGVAHQPAYNRVSAETNVVTGATLLAEVLNYIVKGTVGKPAGGEGGETTRAASAPAAAAAFDPEGPVAPTEANTRDEIAAFAAAHGIDLAGCKTKADQLSVVSAELAAE